jgi:hypothetical protein
MRIPLLLTLPLLAFTAAVAGAQPQVGPVLPRVTEKPDCKERQNDEEIVVCGERYDEDSPYRIPRELRNRGPVEDRHQSWDARVRDWAGRGAASAPACRNAAPSPTAWCRG